MEVTNSRIGPSGKDGREKRRKKLSNGAKIDGQTCERGKTRKDSGRGKSTLVRNAGVEIHCRRAARSYVSSSVESVVRSTCRVRPRSIDLSCPRIGFTARVPVAHTPMRIREAEARLGSADEALRRQQARRHAFCESFPL